MSFDADEEILQDFLVEAGELLESLSEQLVDLENRPDDSDLLNAIFRGFHTVKGGAGFLQLEPLSTYAMLLKMHSTAFVMGRSKSLHNSWMWCFKHLIRSMKCLHQCIIELCQIQHHQN